MRNRVSAAYKRRDKNFMFFDYSEFNSPKDILRILENPDFGVGSIFLFSYYDMLEMSDCVNVLRDRLPTIIFVPYQKAKIFISHLYKTQTTVIKSHSPGGQSNYKILISALRSVQQELSIPICLFNPPREDE